MLRRPPTVLTLTSEDVKAYEDHREAEAFQHATAAAQLRRQQQLARNMSGMDITGITTSSDEEDYSEQEASYYPNRTYSQNPRVSREENIEGPPDEGIYRNEEDPDHSYEDASESALAGEEAFIEHQYMAEAEQMDLDADHTDEDDYNEVPAAPAPNLHHDGRQQPQHQQEEPIFPSPPPAPSRMTRSTRSASTEPSSSQAQQHHHQQQQQHQQQLQAPAGRFPRATGAAQTHRRAPSGRAAAAEATTPTPVAQIQRDAADRARSRTTRSRDERIGVTRGGRR